MPNRNTFDERDKYDHSSHPIAHSQPSDPQPDIQDDKDESNGNGDEPAMEKAHPSPAVRHRQLRTTIRRRRR
jgi:hypothetical protein